MIEVPCERSLGLRKVFRRRELAAAFAVGEDLRYLSQDLLGKSTCSKHRSKLVETSVPETFVDALKQACPVLLFSHRPEFRDCIAQLEVRHGMKLERDKGGFLPELNCVLNHRRCRCRVWDCRNLGA